MSDLRREATNLYRELSSITGSFAANMIVDAFTPDHIPFPSVQDVPETALPTLIQRLANALLEAYTSHDVRHGAKLKAAFERETKGVHHEAS